MTGRKRGLTEFQRVLSSPVCLWWPDECPCLDNLVLWQDALLDDERTLTSEEVECAEEVIFYTCACAAHRCPDQKIKEYAQRQYVRLTVRRIAQQQRARPCQ